MYRSPYTRPKASLSVRIAGATFFAILALSFYYVGSLLGEGWWGWFLAMCFYFIAACCTALTVQAAFDL